MLDFIKQKGNTDARGQTAKAMELLKSKDADSVMQALGNMVNKANKIALGVQKQKATAAADQSTIGESAPGILGLSDEMRKVPRITD